MKKSSYSFLFILLFMINHAATASNDFHLSAEKKIIIDKNKYYTIQIKYPKLFKQHFSLEQNFDKAIQDALDVMIDDFTKNLPSTQPINADSNTLEINYKIYDRDKRHISILFNQNSYFYGAAHPNLSLRSLNYAIQTGKTLLLSDLFKSDKNYLNILSQICFKQLKPKLSKGDPTYTFEMLREGVKPTIENFRVWNFTEKGLLFSFPPYQVAPYAQGPQECLVPYDAIK